MKKKIKDVFLSFLCLVPFMIITEVQALSVDENNLTINNGEVKNISLYANTDESIKEVDFSLVFTSYDVEADFVALSRYTETIDGVNYKIVFDEAKTGKILLGNVVISVKNDPTDLFGMINIHTVKAISVSNETINLNNQVINVNVNMVTTTDDEVTTTTTTTKTTTTTTKKTETTTKRVDNIQLLKRIESSYGNIDIQDGVFEYDIIVSSNVLELDLVPIVKDDNSKIEMTSQKISELKDNKIIVTITNGNKKEEYVVNVKKEKKVEKVSRVSVAIDNAAFVGDVGYKKNWGVVLLISGVAISVALLLMKKKK